MAPGESRGVRDVREGSEGEANDEGRQGLEERCRVLCERPRN